MRRFVPALLGALLLVGCSTGSGAVDVNNGGEFRFVAGTPAGEVIPPDERAAAPKFSGALLDGSEFSSTELAGSVAVLNFWGSWCAPCRVETPEFQDVYAEVRDRGVAFLGLNVKETSEQFARAFVDRFGIQFPSLYDPRGEVALAFRGYPRKRGAERFRGVIMPRAPRRGRWRRRAPHRRRRRRGRRRRSPT